jgi:class 3 adenylate cyclase
MEPRIQYAKTEDGVSIAFWTMGEGGVPLIMSPPLAWSHTTLELSIPELIPWYERLASRRMLIRYDPRNQGLSERGVERLSEADQAADIEAVIERLELGEADLLGFYTPGGPMLRFAAEHQDTVRKLVLWSISVDGRSAFGNPRMLAVRGLSETDWVLFTETFARSMLGWSGDEAHEWARFLRRAVGQHEATLLMAAWAEIDWGPWLERISAPTLVLQHSSVDPWDEATASRIPDAQLVQLKGGPPVYLHEAGTRALEEFLTEGQDSEAPPPTPSGMAVILFLDIADSTALTTKLGDAAYRERERELDGSLRQAIREAGGTPVEGKVLGDGVMAVFTSARQAIEAAQRCRDLGNEADLPLHLGINAGDVVREGNNVHGGAVQLAARVQGVAAPGEILVSATVRDLARTSAGVSFEDRGEHELKGIAGPQRLFAVKEQET